MKEKIIIDTDPGQDDAIAILMALASEELDVLGITTVAGNVSAELTEINARKICELAGRHDLRVYKGATRPLLKTLVTGEHVHGSSGMDGPVLPEPVMPSQEQHAVDFIIETLRMQPAEHVTLCTLGALTNLALAFSIAPDIVRRVKRIIMMGGGFFEGGNITPTAEFNFFVDPHAAKAVLSLGIDITIIPLDITHNVLTSKSKIAKFKTLGSCVAEACVTLMEYHERFDVEKYGSDGGPLHDPNVIACLLKPELYQGKLVNVEINTDEGLAHGMSVVDWWRVTDRKPNATYLTSVDSDGFFELLYSKIALY
ncbi:MULTISPECIES: nucleoside hydrolase [Klebsiella]|uniref:nucleoside hydrolase n=1 Tax=Klebsiella TaxID=570 RepID=UPI000C287621|nr:MULTISPECIES: nucleoside hydrolase [Klebsiella]MCE5369800.1 nucleoside hydrolase [Klebsiella oxytoca]PJR61332.1 nucleoside hydrolase [Klebsiella sp. K-Nf6]